jgi:hypothetical protein
MMKRTLISTGIALVLALGVVAPASLAKGKTKHSAEYYAAVKTCNVNYNAAMKEAKTKKGNEKSEAITAAKASHKQCIDAAPK